MSTNTHNKKYLQDTRKELRKNITPEELVLWYQLRNNRFYGYNFKRQHSAGNFIVDFYCPLKKLAIELDGSQHLDNIEYDKERTNFLESLGIKVIRFWNNEVNKNLHGVLLKIKEELETQTPS